MIDLKLPKSSDDKEMLKTLESIAFESSLHISRDVRASYDRKVFDWINSFTGDLAFKKQRYITHYLVKKYEYLNGKTSI